MVDFSDLPPPVQKMFRNLTSPPSVGDVALARHAQVSDTVKIYSSMATGSSADGVWRELRAALVRRHGEPATPDDAPQGQGEGGHDEALEEGEGGEGEAEEEVEEEAAEGAGVRDRRRRRKDADEGEAGSADGLERQRRRRRRAED
eukprot:Hpha_TRINITY_DN12916_c0_g4::TRINITY_DN12916_c0_g4_i1::g.164566::m.164566